MRRGAAPATHAEAELVEQCTDDCQSMLDLSAQSEHMHQRAA